MRRLRLFKVLSSCSRKLCTIHCSSRVGSACYAHYWPLGNFSGNSVQGTLGHFLTCSLYTKSAKSSALWYCETASRFYSTSNENKNTLNGLKRPDGSSELPEATDSPSTSKDQADTKVQATTVSGEMKGAGKTSSVIDNIKGSDVIGITQQGTKSSNVKRVVKVVPTTTKISEMPGGADKTGTKRSSKLITALRAMNEYCLDEKHLEALPRFERRSAYFGELPTIMYTEADVERLAIKIHGSKAKQRRLSYQAALLSQSNNIFGLGAGDEEQSQFKRLPLKFKSKERVWEESRLKRESLFAGSGLVVLLAIAVNATNAALKFVAWFYTGSHSMFAESVHSLADTANQIILAVGIHQSIKKPDPIHPYGYSNLRHVTSLISGVGIFFLGTGLSVYNGIHGLMYPLEMHPMYWTFVLLGGSFLSEGATLLFAYHNIRKKALEHHMTIRQFVWESQEPGLNVVLLEDCASVLGVSIAAMSIALSQVLNSTVPDAIGSLTIGTLLGVVASFIIYTNSAHLVGKSMPQDEVIQIIRELETDSIIRSVQDVKTTELGGDQIRFKAEVDLDGYQMTKAYLKTQDLAKILEEVQSFEKTADLEKFLLCHGEQIVDRVGAEIDRIEQVLKQKHPDLRHVDLEVL